MTTFPNVICARCSVIHHNIVAKTMAGAIRKATLECKGIVHTKEGAKPTVCAQGYVREIKDE